MNITVKITHTREYRDNSVYLVKITNHVGDFWLVEANRISDQPHDAFVFVNRQDALAAVNFLEPRLQQLHVEQGWPAPRLSIIKCNKQ
jgi:hypothetical protein